jgi:nanoRNase/pAp phosphatase (c-di-AMP/oligoRNAs hydrolase)
MGMTPNLRLRELRAVLRGSRRPLILVCGNPDPDALASAWALREILRGWRLAADIRYTGEVGRPENEAAIRCLRIPARRGGSECLATADRLALVDAQPGFLGDTPLPRCDVVIDHHPPRLDRRVPFSDIRPRCLSTSSILTEYLRAARVPLPRNLATALYYGLDTDGRRGNTPPTATDMAAIAYLTPRVNWTLLRRIEFSSYSLARLDYFSIALIRLRHARNVLYSNVGPVPSADVCAQIADFLMRVKEASWALVCGAVGRKLVVVFRCDGQNRHAGRLAEAAFRPLGSAGGHRTMGRAEIEESALPGGIVLTESERVNAFLFRALADVEHGFRPLLRVLRRG